MAVPRIAFFQDEIYPQLKPFYESAIQKGFIASAGTLAIENNQLICRDPQNHIQKSLTFQYAAAGALKRFISFRQPLVSFGVPENRIIDGCIFAIPGIDLPRFFTDGSVHGALPPGLRPLFRSMVILPVPSYLTNELYSMEIGRLSYISSGFLEGRGNITIGNFSGIAWKQSFELGINNGHHSERVFAYDWGGDQDWPDFQEAPPVGCITIGSDVWIGRGCHLKAASHPLTIGNGAIIASNSNVVKDVPPYAIVGGNPARFIRWRFPEKIREALQTIRWWDWPLEKIHAARLDMKDPAAFVEKYLTEAE